MIITLILIHRYSSKDLSALPTSPSHLKATLIISPKFILSQWIDEISRNAGGMRYIVYEGQPIEFDYLKDYDIVFTTYDQLKKEIHFANAGRDMPRRHNRHFEVKKSFLKSYTWWRVVLDEAQMVESTVGAAASINNL